MVEHAAVNRRVVGSSPTRGAIFRIAAPNSSTFRVYYDLDRTRASGDSSRPVRKEFLMFRFPVFVALLTLTPCPAAAGEYHSDHATPPGGMPFTLSLNSSERNAQAGSELYRELSRFSPGKRIRVEQNDKSDVGALVAFTTETLTLSQEGRDVNFAMGDVTKAWVHKGESWKGALIGGAIGLAIAIPMIISSVNATGDDYGAVTGPIVFVLTTSLGAVLGGIDHWVKIYPD